MSKTRPSRVTQSSLRTFQNSPLQQAEGQESSPKITLPELYCPFPTAFHRHAEMVDARTNAWVRYHKLFTSASDYYRFSRVRLGWLAARTTPRATLTALQLITDWCSWFFVRDDYCDEQGMGRDPQAMVRLHTRFMDILYGAVPDTDDNVLTHALYDLWRRTAPDAASEWKMRFIADIGHFFAAGVWEAENRAAGNIPSVTAYMQMRPFTGGLFAYIDLLELSEQISLPDDLRAQPTIQQMLATTNNVVCWANDIMSLDKEMKQGDIHNLVLSMRETQHLSLQEAIDRAAVLHDSEVRNFIKLELEIPSFKGEYSKIIERYTGCLKSFMRGSMDWLLTSGRYLTTEHK